MRRTGKAIGTLAAATSLALLGGGLASADQLRVDVTSGGAAARTMVSGSTTGLVANYSANKQGNTCDVADMSVAISVPTGASVNNSSVALSDCDTPVSRTFTSSTPGSYSITHAISDPTPGDGWTNQANFTLLVLPRAASTLLATAGDAKVDVSWTASPDSAIDGYKVISGEVVNATTTATSASITGLTNGTEVCFTVKAYKGTLESAATSQACATPQAAPSDTAPPTISFITTGNYVPNGTAGSGWFKRASDGTATTAVVRVEASDPSGVTSLECAVNGGAAQALTSATLDGKRWGEISRSTDGVSNIACVASDGTNATPATTPATHALKLDNTLPTVTCPTASANVVLLNATGAFITASVSDGTTGSGLPGTPPPNTKNSGILDTSAMTVSSTAITITDIAGNQGVGDSNGPDVAGTGCAYSVRPVFVATNKATDGGLTKVKAGSAVPLKFALEDANQVPVTSITTANLTVRSLVCGSTATADSLTETATGSSGLQNFGDGTYQFNWKSPSTYAGSCRTLTLDLGAASGGLTSTADFNFTK